jgi:hypothetical protein
VYNVLFKAELVKKLAAKAPAMKKVLQHLSASIVNKETIELLVNSALEDSNGSEVVMFNFLQVRAISLASTKH